MLATIFFFTWEHGKRTVVSAILAEWLQIYTWMCSEWNKHKIRSNHGQYPNLSSFTVLYEGKNYIMNTLFHHILSSKHIQTTGNLHSKCSLPITRAHVAGKHFSILFLGTTGNCHPPVFSVPVKRMHCRLQGTRLKIHDRNSLQIKTHKRVQKNASISTYLNIFQHIST